MSQFEGQLGQERGQQLDKQQMVLSKILMKYKSAKSTLLSRGINPTTSIEIIAEEDKSQQIQQMVGTGTHKLTQSNIQYSQFSGCPPDRPIEPQINQTQDNFRRINGQERMAKKATKLQLVPAATLQQSNPPSQGNQIKCLLTNSTLSHHKLAQGQNKYLENESQKVNPSKHMIKRGSLPQPSLVSVIPIIAIQKDYSILNLIKKTELREQVLPEQKCLPLSKIEFTIPLHVPPFNQLHLSQRRYIQTSRPRNITPRRESQGITSQQEETMVEEYREIPTLTPKRVPRILVSEGSPQQRRCNTSTSSLLQLVKALFTERIISEKLYTQFSKSHSISDIQDYLTKFRSGRLHLFDFTKHKFTLLDHRRVAELLVNLHGNIYYVGRIASDGEEVQQFLANLYQLTAEQYYNLYTKIDQISNVKWWNKILLAQDQRLMENNKQRRMASKRAEQAVLAVQGVVHRAHTNTLQASDDDLPQPLHNKIDPPSKSSLANSSRISKPKQRTQNNQIRRIRELVSSFGKEQKQRSGSIGLSGEGVCQQTMRRKIKFY